MPLLPPRLRSLRPRWSLRRALYPILALPVSIAGVALLVVGRPAVAADWQRSTLRRFAQASMGPVSIVRSPALVLLGLLLDLVAFAVAGYLWLLALANVAYPLRPDTTASSLRHAWGGPTLAGAWSVHAIGGVALFAAIGVPVVNALVVLQVRLARFVPGGSDG